MKAEYIDKLKLQKDMAELVPYIIDGSNASYVDGLNAAYYLICNEPAADVQIVRYGVWRADADGCMCCSLCGNPAEINGITGEFMDSPYCSECGAKMKNVHNNGL